MQEFTVADVSSHKTRDDLWVIIHGKGNLLLALHPRQGLTNTQFMISQNTYEITQAEQTS
jgi:hypothetical protein